MAPYQAQMKPETALKRAEELATVGQHQSALVHLHESLCSSKRYHRTFTPAHTLIIRRIIQLGTELRRGRLVKEAMHSYKNLVQNNEDCEERVGECVNWLIDGARVRMERAREEADGKLSTTAADGAAKLPQPSSAATTATPLDDQAVTAEGESVLEEDEGEDLIMDEDSQETPESLMTRLVGGTSDDTKVRTERELVSPWLRFLWEAYRSVLDVMKNNSKLEVLYQKTAREAFEFCLKNQRKAELRRLCELLRAHLLAVPKSQHQPHSISLQSNPQSLNAHLKTRFCQLDVSLKMGLWQESFKSIEDIFGLLRMSGGAGVGAEMMAEFYEALSKVFWVSGEVKFHAAALGKYHGMLTALGKSTKLSVDVDMSKLASTVILACMSIPLNEDGDDDPVRALMMMDENASRNSTERLTALLGMSAVPTRSALITEIVNRGLLRKSDLVVRQLFKLVEQETNPLTFVKDVGPLLMQLQEDSQYATYIPALRSVILTRLIHELSLVYSVIRLDSFFALAQFPEAIKLGNFEIEKFILRGCMKGQFSCRINHLSRLITFDAGVFQNQHNQFISKNTSVAVSESDQLRVGLSQLSTRLQTACQLLEHDSTYDQKERKSAYDRLRSYLESEHIRVHEHMEMVEKRKEMMDAYAEQEEQRLARERALKAAQEAEAERVRLEELAHKREMERIKKEREEIERKEAQKLAEELQKKNISIDGELDQLDKQALIRIQVEQLDKEKREMRERLTNLAKRIDHTERAYRQEEIPLLSKAWDEQQVKDKQHHEETFKLLLDATKRQFDNDLAVKKRLVKMKNEVGAYRARIEETQGAAIAKEKEERQKKLQDEKAKRIKKLKLEKWNKMEKERMEKEEAERQAAEEKRQEEDKKKAEEERLEKLKKEKEERLSQMRDAAAMAQRQLEREREAEERARQRQLEREREEQAKKAPATGAYRPPGAGAGLSRQSSSSSVTNSSANGSSEAVKQDRYIPPSLRKKMDQQNSSPSGSWRK